MIQLRTKTASSDPLVGYQTNPTRIDQGPYHEAGFDKFPFSLHQSWVLGTMKVAWRLAVFIAIVTYTPRLTCSGVGYVLS